jgi:hypothetical protein
VPGGGQALDVADLGDDQQPDVAADAADLAQHVHARVVGGARVDLDAQRGDLTVKVVDQAQQRIQPAPRLGPQPQLGQKAPAADAERSLC